MPGSVDIPIIQPLPVTGVRWCEARGFPVRFPWDLVLLGSAAMHHSVRSPVTHRASRPHVYAHTHYIHAHAWSINTHGRFRCAYT